MQLEHLKPMKNTEELTQRLKDLKQTLIAVKKKTENLPQGHLKVAVKPGHTEYYHIQECGSSHVTYISKKKMSLASQLAQKDYYLKLIKILEQEIKALERCLRQTCSFSIIQKLYAGLSPERKALITPVTLTEKQYAEEWQKCRWQGKTFFEEESKYYTTKGERVRSKSEVIIADALLIEKIPYRYEFPVRLKKAGKGEITVYPDFTCLNLRTREEMYWEHFGMMDDPDYVQNTISKLSLYAENGIFPGNKLIITMETKSESLNTRDLKRIISEYLK